MLDILGSLAGGILSGGASGLLGVVLQRWADYKNKQLDMEKMELQQKFDLEKRKVDAEILDKEWAHRAEVAKIETAGASDVADAQAFGLSFQLEPKRYAETVKYTTGQGWVLVLLDAFRGAVRPALTLYLCILVTMIYVTAKQKLSAEDLTNEQVLELFKLMLGTICYVWTTITLWWFGTRNKSTQA